MYFKVANVIQNLKMLLKQSEPPTKVRIMITD